jgi:hypothetical protein
MMNQLIAACGLDCSQCEAYKVTLANDTEAMEKLVAQWRVEYNAPDMTIASVICDGCMVGERHGGYCGECPVRKCAVEHGVANCAYCSDYACEKLQGFWQMAPQAKANLEAVYAQLHS